MDFFEWTLITNNNLPLMADTKTIARINVSHVSFCKTTDNLKLSLCCNLFSLLSQCRVYALVLGTKALGQGLDKIRDG